MTTLTTTQTTRYYITSTCKGCGVGFKAFDPRQRRCKPDCNRKRASASANGARAKMRGERLPLFIGVDGEGVQQNGTHDYVLLSVDDKSFHREGAHLQFSEIMEFLYSQYRDDAVYVGYYLGYDFTQWLRTLPEERARMLLTAEGQAKRVRKIGSNPVPFPVRWDGWEFDLLAGKRWKLRPEGTNPWMYICDVGGYFQMPFVKASEPSEWHDAKNIPIEIATPEEQEIIARGKAKRASAGFDHDMILYNQTENAVLSRMMTVMATGFQDIGIKLNKSQWIGPGQAVQQWMKDHNTHTREAVCECTEHEILDAARQSFFGGWFEITHHGHVPGTTYEYDINSAYPNIHSQLPCLLHGKWTKGKGKPRKWMQNNRNRLTLVRCEISGSHTRLGTMLHRTSKGRVLRPMNTRGVYWLHEIEASIRAGLIEPHLIKWDSWFHYEPCDCIPPMRDLRVLFDTRVAVGKTTPQGKALKLLYNSAYGKTAQSVGTPRFANPIHASLITAGCRTMILDAIATHPEGADAVVMIATDGIYFSSPHPTLDVGNKLGQWEGAQRENMCLIMPGIYWDDKVRNNRARAKIKSRGINAAALIQAIDTFDEQLARFDPALDDWPTVDCIMNFAMVTAKQALQRNDYKQCGFVQQHYKKTLNSNPVLKRVPPTERIDGKLISKPHWLPDHWIDNTPYEGRFGDELRDKQDAHISDDDLDMNASIAGILYDF